MMTERNFYEQLDAYLKGDLSNLEKDAFEAYYEQDPILKGEVQLQKEIIETLQNYRKSELKNRLGAIVIAGTAAIPWYLQYFKTAAWGVSIAGTIAGGAAMYNSFYTTKTEVKNIIDKNFISESMNEFYVKYSNLQNNRSQKVSDLKEETKNTTYKEITLDPEIALAKANSRYLKRKEDSLDQIRISELYPITVIPVIDSLPDKNPDNSSSVDNNQALKYQFYSNKLVLYNRKSAAKQIPDEVNGITNYYLYYEGNFYELNANQKEKAEPKKVTDSSVINRLMAKKRKYFGD